MDAVTHGDVPVLVQRYHLNGHVYEVFRKSTGDGDSAFHDRWDSTLDRLGEGDLVQPWSISSWLTVPEPEFGAEIFAMVYEDRGDLPGDEGEEDDYLCIVYEPELAAYQVNVPEEDHPTVEGLTAPTLDEARDRGIVAWDTALRATRSHEESL
jgi:hypothetical protein